MGSEMSIQETEQYGKNEAEDIPWQLKELAVLPEDPCSIFRSTY